MLAIEFGKHEECSCIHQEGFEAFPTLIPGIAQVMLDHLPVPFGVAIVENVFDQTFLVEAVPAEAIVSRQPELLKIAYANMARIQVKQIDVVIIDLIGKDISGAGMEPNVVGRITKGILPGYDGPDIRRIIVTGITSAGHENAIGIGLADYCTLPTLSIRSTARRLGPMP